MNKEDLSVLASYFQNQLGIVQNLFEGVRSTSPTDEDKTARAGYLLHNLYCALEDLFLEVARTFENRIEDPSKFHRDLVKRMSLDIARVRPKLLTAGSYSILDELRRFRHVFRHAYDYELEPERVETLRKRVLAHWGNVQADLDRFKQFLSEAVKKGGSEG